MRETEARTLQLWPSGDSLEVRGDSHGPEFRVRKYDHNARNGGRARWHRATDEERRRVQIEELARGYQDRAVLCCDSALVDAMLQAAPEMTGDLAEAFSYDEVQNLYPNPEDWTAERCQEWLGEHGVPRPDDSDPWAMEREDVAEALEALGHAVSDDESDDTLAAALFTSIDAEDWGNVDDWREAVRNNAEAAEVFEWWRIDSWLCEQLRGIGQVVLDNDYGCWWGRTCTGQGFLMDGTLQEVAAQFVH